VILAVLYFLLFCFIISKFSFFKDAQLSMKLIFAVLSVKCLGCFAYYWVYFVYYPANFSGDSVSTMHDARIIYDALPNHPGDFFRMVFGFHSNLDSDPLYEPYFQYIQKWGRADVTTEFFLNDNRTPIRINALIMLISFGSYAVHAFVMLALSFIGQFAFYKAFKLYFHGKELLLAAVIFIAPSVLFWTSGVLKEPIAIFLSGIFVYAFMQLFVNNLLKAKYVSGLIFAVLFFLILKPYILVLLLVPLTLFALVKKYQVKRIVVFYVVSLAIIAVCGLLVLKTLFHKDVINTIVVRQNDFVNLSKGGIFFLNDQNYVRLEYKDSAQCELADREKNLYRLKPHAHLMYWNIHRLRDTIYVTDNRDTALYTLLNSCAPAGSGIDMKRLEYSFGSFAALLPQAFFNVLCKPFFIDAHSFMELVASLENLLFFGFILCCFIFGKRTGVDTNVLMLCITVVITSFLLVGITTTVMGAIVRYKVPFIPFLLMVPLLYLDPARLKNIPFVNRLVK
jgi:hypothetical protein